MLRRAAPKDPTAALELGHLMLQVSWADTQVAVAGDTPEAEHWLRRAVTGRPDDVRAIILLATLLSVQCDRIRDLTAHLRHSKRWDADGTRRAEEAARLYGAALRLDPLSDAAASGLALLSSKQGGGEADEPALTGRFDCFVLEVELIVSNNGETVPRLVVLRDVDQVHRFGACGWHVVAKAVACRYQGGILVARHRESRLSGKSLGRVVDDWQAGRVPTSEGCPLPIGHPVRHKGRILSYGVNGSWMADG